MDLTHLDGEEAKKMLPRSHRQEQKDMFLFYKGKTEASNRVFSNITFTYE